jgi:uncharacterized RDD family membrane protein YckC
MRLIDGLVLYLIGLVAICVTRKGQRLGDLVAGTLVVRRATGSTPIGAEPAYRRAQTLEKDKSW